MTATLPPLTIEQSTVDGADLVRPRGVLDLTSYAQLRDVLIKSVLEQPTAVVVDIGGLRIPTDATLVVFSSVWMQVSEWPGVPIVLVAARELDRHRLRRSAICRYVPVYASVEDAVASIGEPPVRRRVRLELVNSSASVAITRQFVSEICHRWGCSEIFPDAVLVASELVENAVRHTDSEPRLRLELSGERLTIAVYDDDPTPVRLVEPQFSATGHLGLVLVDKLARTWSCAPTRSGGKVVWAVLSLP